MKNKYNWPCRSETVAEREIRINLDIERVEELLLNSSKLSEKKFFQNQLNNLEQLLKDTYNRT